MNDKAVEQARNEVFRKIGRNVVNFQMLEGMLKSLVMSSGVHGKASELQDKKKQQQESVKMRSMGKLVGSLFDSVLNNTSSVEPPDELDEPWLSVSHEIELSEDDATNLKQALAGIVEERNQLIHQRLLGVDFNSIEECTELSALLDLQRDKLIPHFEQVRSFLKDRIDMGKHLEKIYATEEFKTWLSGN